MSERTCACGCGRKISRRATWARGHHAHVVDPIERFWSHTQPDPTGCILWTISTDSAGYGLFWVGGKHVKAHRFAYELLVGEIPDGLELDHLCRVRRCVNVEHLEAVTPRVNNLRGFSPFAINARKTHCKRGHPFTTANTYIMSNGGRRCRTCKNAAMRAARKRKGIAWTDRTHCKNGHPFDEANTIVTKEGWRRCGTCPKWRRAQKLGANELSGGRSSRRRGHDAERKLAGYLRAAGFKDALTSRAGLGSDGTRQAGDIIGGPPGWLIECKDVAKPSWGAWLAKAEREAAGGPFVVVLRLRGNPNVAEWECRYDDCSGGVRVEYGRASFGALIDRIRFDESGGSTY